MPERDEVWTADLNPLIETEPEKARPVLIGQAQALFDAEHRSSLAAPLPLAWWIKPSRSGIRTSGSINCARSTTAD